MDFIFFFIISLSYHCRKKEQNYFNYKLILSQEDEIKREINYQLSPTHRTNRMGD